MKFTVKTSDFADILRVARLASDKQQQHVLVRAVGGQVSLRCAGLAMQAEGVTPRDESSDGDVVLPLDKLTSFVANASADEFAFERTPKAVLLSAHGYKARVE